MSENNTQTPAQEKPRRSKEDILEIIIAVFLGVTALATAWASWIGSLHGGNMSTNYTKSNNLAADGNARWNEASRDAHAGYAGVEHDKRLPGGGALRRPDRRRIQAV